MKVYIIKKLVELKKHERTHKIIKITHLTRKRDITIVKIDELVKNAKTTFRETMIIAY